MFRSLCVDEDSWCFVRYRPDEVILGCRRAIQIADERRSQRRREKVARILEEQTKGWRRYWRWLGFRQPTRRDAIYYYRHAGSFMSDHDDDVLLHSHSVFEINRILHVAEQAERLGKPSVLLTRSGASLLDL